MISHILSMVKVWRLIHTYSVCSAFALRIFFHTHVNGSERINMVAVRQICIFCCSSKLKHILMQHIAYIVLDYHKYLKHLSQLSFKWFDTNYATCPFKTKKIINWVVFL